MQMIFNRSGAFWNWLVQSSADPNKVALFVKGLTSLAAVQALFGLLPLIGIHPSFDLNSLGDQVYTITYGGLTAISGLATAWGAVRKIYLFFVPPKASL